MSDTVKNLIGRPLKDQRGQVVGTITRAFISTSQGERKLHVEAVLKGPDGTATVRGDVPFDGIKT